MDVKFVFSPVTPDLPPPAYETEGSAGMDLRADLGEDGCILLENGESAVIPTGIRVAIPQGFELQIRPRSGLAAKHRVTVLNSPGTIDGDYRGEVGVILINHGDAFEINAGDRIAQGVFAPIVQAKLTPVKSLDETARGAGGFGSTGV